MVKVHITDKSGQTTTVAKTWAFVKDDRVTCELLFTIHP